MMNKSELITAIASRTGLTKKDTEATLNNFIEVVTETLQNKGKIQLIGFGTFLTRKREARVGRNIQTGEEIHIPSCNVPAFKAGKTLKNLLSHK